MKCCICGKEFEGWGNNANPVKDGTCCDDCNDNVVLPVRIGWFKIENWRIEDLTGYKPQTTFYTDFSIAEKFGVEAIKETYETAFGGWKSNVVYITELCMVLNWKIHRWWQVNEEYAKLYDELWSELDSWCCENLKGKDLEYFYNTTD